MTAATAVARPLLRTFEGRAMGSPLRLTVPDLPDGPDGVDTWQLVVDEFEVAEAALSRFRDSSELTRLNRRAGSGQAVVTSSRLRIALIAAERARRVTDGRFDPRVLDDLDRLGYRGAPLDVEPMLADRAAPSGPVLRHAGRTGLVVDDRIDLGGIGKGLTLRWAAARLERDSCATFLLEAGGDLVARGHPPNADAWVVGIEDRPAESITSRRSSAAPAVRRLPPRRSDESLAHRRPECPSPARSHDGEPSRSGLQSDDGDGTDPHGRGLVESALPRRFQCHRRGGTRPRHRGVVDRCVGSPGDDTGSPVEDGLGGREG